MEAAKRNICIAVQEKEHNPQIATKMERWYHYHKSSRVSFFNNYLQHK
jgi:hypothetical protein